MKKSIVVILCALLAAGCTAIREASTKHAANPRIVYRDLTRPKPVRYPIPPAHEQEALPDGKSNVSTAVHRPEYFIAFDNESASRFDQSTLLQFASETDNGALVLVVGHSHGQSAVGTMKLAARRAQAVKSWLTDRGFAHVQLMAAWGGEPVNFAPSRGVHLYVLEPGDNESMPIVFAKQIEEKTHESPQVSDQMAHHRPPAGRLGDV